MALENIQCLVDLLFQEATLKCLPEPEWSWAGRGGGDAGASLSWESHSCSEISSQAQPALHQDAQAPFLALPKASLCCPGVSLCDFCPSLLQNHQWLPSDQTILNHSLLFRAPLYTRPQGAAVNEMHEVLILIRLMIQGGGKAQNKALPGKGGGG